MTIGVLSWGAHKTLINTLESYKKFNLDTWDSQRVIFFQEISNEDREIARRYGWKAIGDTTNIGIGPAYRELVEYATGDLFLFLENDWELIRPVRSLLTNASYLLQLVYGGIDVVRLRSRMHPGYPLWTLQFKDNELVKPTHLLDCIHWTDPMKFYPIIKEAAGGYYVTSAKNANWTNNPTLFRTRFLLDHIVKRVGNRDLEKDIQGWWEQQSFGVAQGEGAFTHNRID